MRRIAVIYWSGTGHTQAMAEAVNRGACGELFSCEDFPLDQAAGYDAFALGCPAMGDEVLEEEAFAPCFAALKGALAGKPTALFGSYGWGDGAWMRAWEEECQAAGIPLAAESVICQDEPDDAALAACEALGAALR